MLTSHPFLDIQNSTVLSGFLIVIITIIIINNNNIIITIIIKRKSHEAPHYAVFSSCLALVPSYDTNNSLRPSLEQLHPKYFL
jgi:hypothetical protein